MDSLFFNQEIGAEGCARRLVLGHGPQEAEAPASDAKDESRGLDKRSDTFVETPIEPYHHAVSCKRIYPRREN